LEEVEELVIIITIEQEVVGVVVEVVLLLIGMGVLVMVDLVLLNRVMLEVLAEEEVVTILAVEVVLEELAQAHLAILQ
jgi:hypothetical protein